MFRNANPATLVQIIPAMCVKLFKEQLFAVVGNNTFKYYFVLFWNNINKQILSNANNTK